jgi:hypothetical protein
MRWPGSGISPATFSGSMPRTLPVLTLPALSQEAEHADTLRKGRETGSLAEHSGHKCIPFRISAYMWQVLTSCYLHSTYTDASWLNTGSPLLSHEGPFHQVAVARVDDSSNFDFDRWATQMNYDHAKTTIGYRPSTGLAAIRHGNLERTHVK